jgi:hypothetical protein
MATQPEVIESTAGQVADELARRGVAPDQRVTILIEPDEPNDWITRARQFARQKVIPEGWTDADIDRILKEQRRAVLRAAQAAARDLATPGPSAARSQDFLYDKDGLPG